MIKNEDTFISCFPISSWLQSFPATGSFPMSWLFSSEGQIIGASTSASVLPMNIQGWFPLGLIGLISLQSRNSQSFPGPEFESINYLVLSLLYGPTLTYIYATPWTAAHQASLSFTTAWSLLKLMSIKLMMTSNHLILCCPLLLVTIFPSIRVFLSETALHIRWPNYWSFNFSISPSSEYSGLIFFWMDWLYLLELQGILKSLQHHSSKASILQHSAFFIVQLSHPYMTTGKTIPLTRWTFVGKVMSLLLNMLSSLVITFLPRSKCLLISWLQSPSAVILEPRKIKSDTVSTVSPSISHEVMRPECHDLRYLNIEI